MASYDLDIDAAPRTLVFRAVDQLLRNDPILKGVVRGDKSFRSWKGDLAEKDGWGVNHAPAIRITPSNGPIAYATPGSLVGNLWINVELIVRGWNVDNMVNLWWAVQRAIYPKDQTKRLANVQTLQKVGLRNQVSFTAPVFDPVRALEAGHIEATGQIIGQVEEQLNN